MPGTCYLAFMLGNASATTPAALSAPARWLLLALAGVCLLLGIVGVFIPILPTVPFLIVAAWAASRSSPRLHRWLLSHPRFGHLLRDWHEAGVVPRRAKWLATLMMAASGATMLFIVPANFVPGVLLLMAAMVAVAVWLWRRPERRG
jgi:uncharacterized membrane protein YbaN (DUF454 family)